MNALDTAGAQDLAIFELLRQRLVKSVPVANPAAGADWNAVVPAGCAWELLSAEGTLTTSAAVANRVPNLRIRDAAGLELSRIGPQAVQAATLVGVFSYLVGFGTVAGVSGQQMPLPSPPFFLPSGWQVGSVTTAIDVADQWSAVTLAVREWSGRAVLLALEWLRNHTR